MKTSALPPIPRDFTRTIAERFFELRDERGSHPVRVEFGEPAQDVVVIGGTDWRCPMRITNEGQTTVRSIVGIDSLQALQLAINVARAQLEALANQPGATLLYLDEPIDTTKKDWPSALL